MKKVTVVVACRNEEAFIGPCLRSLIDQDYPADLVEIIVVDGMSTDQTWGVANTYRETYPNIRLEVNQMKFKYPALNQAIKQAKGDCIAIVDAHSWYPKDYLARCVSFLHLGYADNVGGGRIFHIRSKGWLSKAISFALTLPFRPSHD
jgi:glycosyltransferase involved in cell wall biosynthesis